MAKSRYEFFEDVWNDDIQHTQKFVLDNELKVKLNEYDYVLYTIPLAEEFRPDAIAYNFYGDGKLYWVLVYVNEIDDSPAGFYANREIKIPSPDILGNLV